MRAVSTILAVSAAGLLAAEGAGAQSFYEPNTLWLSAAVGWQRAVSISDKQSEGGWLLSASRPLTVSLDWGRASRTFGVRVHRTVSPMKLENYEYAGNHGEVQSLSVIGAYRASQQLGETPIRQFIELGAGITRWSDMRGRNGDRLPVISPVYDFTYSAAIGLGLALRDRLEGFVMFDILMVRHVQQVLVLTPNAKAEASFGLPSLRLGARYRLGN
ncbi:MAG: hypothetical protein Q8K55_00490 [Gemmatimonadaceae bacterium]|nr:hypothetical protein [Gemmatimonadaceae bacterium]